MALCVVNATLRRRVWCWPCNAWNTAVVVVLMIDIANWRGCGWTPSAVARVGRAGDCHRGDQGPGAGCTARRAGRAWAVESVRPAPWLLPPAPAGSPEDRHDAERVHDLLDRLGMAAEHPAQLEDRVDAMLLHRVAGPLLLAVLFLMFQAVFAWAQAPNGRHQGGDRWQARS